MSPLLAPIALAQLSGLPAACSRAIPLDREPAQDHERSLWQRRSDWHATLEDHGLTLGASLVSDSSWPLAGVRSRRRTTRTLFDASLELDLEHVAGIRGTRAFVEVYAQVGRDGSLDVGDAQAYSNLDAPNVAQLAELWIEHEAAGGALCVLLGKRDANADFAAVEAGVGFLHSSAGNSPTLLAFPTYPDPAFGLSLFATPFAGWSASVGVFDSRDGGAVSGRRGLTAEFDAAFFVGQVDRRWSALAPGFAGLAGRLALGGWHHSGRLPRFDGGREHSTSGAFAILEQELAHLPRLVPCAQGDAGELTAFLQWGHADEDLSVFERHLAGGLVSTDLVPGGPGAQTGLYLSHVTLTDEPGAGVGGGDELAVELFHELHLLEGVVLKPDLQWIVSPSGRRRARDVWVATIRLELSL